ncbi:MAG: hypothetical protein IJH34_09765 [Romboutsia sp.]|nr:hypothetical protein [Romboutsia sp.]
MLESAPSVVLLLGEYPLYPFRLDTLEVAFILLSPVHFTLISTSALTAVSYPEPVGFLTDNSV